MQEALKEAASAGGGIDPELAAALRAAPPFCDLPDVVLGAVAEIATARKLRAGETVFTIGQYDGHEFYLVASGELKAAHAVAGGEMHVESIAQGKFYGLAAAVAESVRDAEEQTTLTAEQDTTVVLIEAATFREVVAHRPSLARALMLHFATAIANAAAARAPGGAPERRIFAALLGLAVRDGATGEWRVARMPKHRELAEKAGADEAAVANAVARLIQDGSARRDYPGLVITDMARLNRLAS